MEGFVKPNLEILDAKTVRAVVEAAYEILKNPGFTVRTEEGLKLMADAGAVVDFQGMTVRVNGPMIDRALSTVPSGFTMWDQCRTTEAACLEGDRVHFVTDGTAILVQDYDAQKPRPPVTKDMIEHLTVMDACEHIALSSATFALSDVPKEVADTYRLFLSLLYSNKPVMVTAFSREGYQFQKEMNVVMAGDEGTMRKKPSHLFPVNISSPLSWSELTGQNLIDAARDDLPIKLIPIPVAGGNAPVTLLGTLVQVTAENLCGVLLHQAANPGGRLVYGGGPTVLDMRYGTTPMASIESIIMGAANTQIGKYLGLPTSTNIGRSDSKKVDMQSGLETGMAMLVATLAGTNCIRGAGMLEYATVQSLEKLLLDNEICGMCLHAARGVNFTAETLAVATIKEFTHGSQSFLASRHTLEWFQKELYMPSDLIDRFPRSTYEERGSKNARERARDRVLRILSEHKGGLLEDDPRGKELCKLMKAHARRHGVDRLPIEDWARF